jgi:VanZ family protein
MPPLTHRILGPNPTWPARLVALSLVAIIVALSLVPGSERPHTGASGRFEHLMAYCGATFAICIAAARPPLASIVAAFSLLAGAMEITQRFIPGRTFKLVDWVASSAGAALGAVMAAAVLWAIRGALRLRASRSGGSAL